MIVKSTSTAKKKQERLTELLR